jgi:hypothetical protein
MINLNFGGHSTCLAVLRMSWIVGNMSIDLLINFVLTSLSMFKLSFFLNIYTGFGNIRFVPLSFLLPSD